MPPLVELPQPPGPLAHWLSARSLGVRGGTDFGLLLRRCRSVSLDLTGLEAKQNMVVMGVIVVLLSGVL